MVHNLGVPGSHGQGLSRSRARGRSPRPSVPGRNPRRGGWGPRVARGRPLAGSRGGRFRRGPGRTPPAASPARLLPLQHLPHLLLEAPVLLLDLGQLSLAFGLQVGVLSWEDPQVTEWDTVPPASPPPTPTCPLSPHLPLQDQLFPLIDLLLFVKVGCLQFLGKEGEAVTGALISKGAPRAPRPPILTISHSLRTTLTCVRIWSTLASSTDSSSSFFSVEARVPGGGRGQTRQGEGFWLGSELPMQWGMQDWVGGQDPGF